MASLIALSNGLYVLDETPGQSGGVALNDNFTLLDAHLGDEDNPHNVDWADLPTGNSIGRDLLPDSSGSRYLGNSSYSWYYVHGYYGYFDSVSCNTLSVSSIYPSYISTNYMLSSEGYIATWSSNTSMNTYDIYNVGRMTFTSSNFASSAADGTIWQYNGVVYVKSGGDVIPLTNERVVNSKATSYSVTAGDSGSSFVNSASATFTLPAATVGLTYTFCQGVAGTLQVAVQVNEYLDGTQDGVASGSGIDDVCVIACFVTGRWSFVSQNGYTVATVPPP